MKGDAVDRRALFVSHANPEDNAFTLWLGSRLSAAGYEVWADVLRLRGGQDWQRLLEKTLRNRARKVLFVGTRQSAQKQGVRNEIQIAHDVGRGIGDSEFVIPLRLNRFDAPFLIAHAQYINFERSWASGLAELLDTLEETYHVPRATDSIYDSVRHWRAVQLRHAKNVSSGNDLVFSNWVPLTGIPESLTFYDFRAGISIDAAKQKMETSEWPLVPYHRGFLSFAGLPELEEHFGAELPLYCANTTDTETFLNEGWIEKRIRRLDARNFFTNLARQGAERSFAGADLQAYEMANGELAWWPTTHTIPIRKVPFQWPYGVSGRRQLTGHSETRKLYWHFGVTPRPRVFPYPHLKLVSRVIFTEDGETPIESRTRMHRLRRSFCRSWRNPKWRDMLLAFLAWLANKENRLTIAMGSTVYLHASLPVAMGAAPFSIHAEGDKGVDVDSMDELYTDDLESSFVDDELGVEEQESIGSLQEADEAQ